MADDFKYDVFLSHSSKDKVVVREIAEQLRGDGVRVWFGDWEIRPGDSIPAKIEEGLECSRVLVLCMSTNALGSEWTQLESGTFRFRDPLNKERRFIALRLDGTPIKGPLTQFSYVNWWVDSRENAYVKLLKACRSPAEPSNVTTQRVWKQVADKSIQLDFERVALACIFSPDEKRVVSGGNDNAVRLWDVRTRSSLCLLEGHTSKVWSVAWSPDQRHIVSGGLDNTIRLWDVETGTCLRVLKSYRSGVWSLSWSNNQRYILSGHNDSTVRLWEVETGHCLHVFEGHISNVFSLSWSSDDRCALSGSFDSTVRLWDMETRRCLQVLEGHTGNVLSVSWSPNQREALSGSDDKTIRLWDLETGRCLRVLEGHTEGVKSVLWSNDGSYALSGAKDETIRLWDVKMGRCLRILKGHTNWVMALSWSPDKFRALSLDAQGGVRVWNLSGFIAEVRASKATVPVSLLAPDQVQYTNAKVLLVGESGVGKTGLSKRLALNDWQPSDSTVGAWATQWKLPVSSGDDVEREIWLWDFGGQADQRLIHQLYMDETALAVLVFDGQKEDLFDTLGQWDRDLARASRKAFSKLLVAGRVDAGGLRVSRNQIEAFKKERGYLDFLETSAKTELGCEELKQAILNGIRWEDIPWRSSPLLFKRLKEEIVYLKDASRVLMRFNELRETLTLRLAGEVARFTDDELKAVISLLAGPGVVWELKFGSWILLQPERINAYAQAVIHTMRADEQERGCLPEERVLKGDLTYHSSMARLEADDERFVLLAMHQTLVERGLCLREHTDKGPLLVFPSYYRRERPELMGHPAVLVSYRFNGFIDDIYATLVVRLHHTRPFQQDQLWRYAADFKTLTRKQLGVKLTRRAEGAGELEVYFDPTIAVEEKIIFSKYVHEHLLQNAKEVVRLRHYVCPYCGTPVGNREVAMRRLDGWLHKRPTEAGAPGWIKQLDKADPPTIICSECEKRVPLWDELEQSFASPEIQQQVHDLQEQSTIVLDSESKERVLVGEVISVVALADQICREKSVSDHGIDMEIEFKDDNHEATGEMVLLQLKSGDSYLRKRQSDGAEIFTIKDERHARYWMAQKFPVLLVIRSSAGEVRWMEVGKWLWRASDSGRKAVKQIVFEGERLDVMSVRRWREKVLGRR